MALTKVTSGMVNPDPTNASNLSSGDVPLAQLGNAPATDTSGLRNDIATLALHSAIADNKAAYNLSNAFIDQFEDDTGIDAETTTDRDANEYMCTRGMEANTKLYMDFETSAIGMVGGDGYTAAVGNSAARTTSDKKFGSASLDITGNTDYLSLTPSSSGFLGSAYSGDFTIEFWSKRDGGGGSFEPVFIKGPHDDNAWDIRLYSHPSSNKLYTDVNLSGGNAYFPPTDAVTGRSSWTHYAIVRDGDICRLYIGGVQRSSVTSSGGSLNTAYDSFHFGAGWITNQGSTQGFYDDIRFSDNCRYPDGTTFTPHASAHEPISTYATGNFTSATQTASSSVSEMGIVVLYKNNEGTASLNTDLVAQVSANGGTNYSSATLVAGGTFSSGINIAAVSGVSVTAGTAPKYKISFANQVASSKETQVHGVALLY